MGGVSLSRNGFTQRLSELPKYSYSMAELSATPGSSGSAATFLAFVSSAASADGRQKRALVIGLSFPSENVDVGLDCTKNRVGTRLIQVGVSTSDILSAYRTVCWRLDYCSVLLHFRRWF